MNRTHYGICGVGAMMALAAAGWAQKESSLPDGVAALDRGDLEHAQAAFEQRLADDQASKRGDALADDFFYLGLIAQRSAGKGSADRAAALGRAGDNYRRALEQRPKFPSALNNLAEVALAQGKTDAALDLRRRAVEVAGSRRGAYAQKYGELLLQTGNWREGCRNLFIACSEQPTNEVAYQRLVETCLEFDPPSLIGYLWQLTYRGQVTRTFDTATLVFKRDVWSDTRRSELAAVIAVSLSAQNFKPPEFSSTPFAKRLHELDHESIRELIVLHTPPVNPEAFSWWKERVQPRERPERGIWPEEAFCRLARSLAARWRTLEPESKYAESYYELAAFLNPTVPDTEALTRLAEIYGDADRLAKLADIMKQHEHDLFEVKGQAYANSDLMKVYQLHATLGTIYSALHVWGNSSDPRSAIFQLEHAATTVDRLRDEPPNPNRPRAEFTPRAVELLTNAYVQTGQNQKAFELCVSKIDAFRRLGDKASADAVLRGLERSTLPTTITPQQRNVLEALQRDLPESSNRPSASVTPLDRSQVLGSLLPEKADTTASGLSKAKTDALTKPTQLSDQVKQAALSKTATSNAGP